MIQIALLFVIRFIVPYFFIRAIVFFFARLAVVVAFMKVFYFLLNFATRTGFYFLPFFARSIGKSGASILPFLFISSLLCLPVSFFAGAFLAVFLAGFLPHPQLMHIIQRPLLGQRRNRTLLRHILHRNLLHQEGQCQGQALLGYLRLP